ncbi:MAG: 4-hydroxy-3-methylbut-2-enyl diphosphate reductase [Deltaproteobacteria bacterium]|nr:4-hydroxy-3-methylbut-2-enyl diphosphate reductase [Deltaproteobacteria bacterium]
MKVVIAKTAGFCKGVRSAIEVTMNAIQERQKGEDICTFGPLIHNSQVLSMLAKKGVVDESRIERCAGKKVVIRAHGIPPSSRQKLHEQGANLLDATCKRVAKVHAAIKIHARRGYHTIIVGDADHAEVIGLLGYTENRGAVINRPEQIDDFPAHWEKVLLVAQTTQNEEVFREIEGAFLKKYPHGIVKNTICDSTQERQAEVRQMCSNVDAMVIVGGLNSGNTLRLAEVARDCNIPTFHVETKAELDPEVMARYSCVGVSAGASTPNWIIRDVVDFLEQIRPGAGRRFGFKHLLEVLDYGNFYVALATALLAQIVAALTNLPEKAAFSVMAAGYAFAMHSLNVYLDQDSIELNDPGRAAFYMKWRPVFMASSAVSLGIALVLAYQIGFANFLAMLALVLMGLLYGVRLLLPADWERLPVRIKDIATLKTFLVPMAWAAVCILPYFTSDAPMRVAYAGWAIFLLSLVRTTMNELLAIQGDRLVGKETLVVLAGEKRTVMFVVGAIMVLVLSAVCGPLASISTGFSYFLIVPAAIYGFFLMIGFTRKLREDPIYEVLIEIVLIAAGLCAIAWRLTH